MTDAEGIWKAKTDDDLLVAAAELDTYTEEGQRIIREELRRRGLEDPEEQARFVEPEAGFPQPEDEGELPVPSPRCIRCEVEQRFLGARRFRQAADSGVLQGVGHLFAIDQAFDLYVCPKCGHVDLFVGDGDGEGRSE